MSVASCSPTCHGPGVARKPWLPSLQEAEPRHDSPLLVTAKTKLFLPTRLVFLWLRQSQRGTHGVQLPCVVWGVVSRGHDLRSTWKLDLGDRRLPPTPPFLSPRPHSFLECVFSLPFRLPGATPRTQPKVLLTLSGC